VGTRYSYIAGKMYCTLTTGFHMGKWVWDFTPPSKHTHIQHISPIFLHINLLIFQAKASGHTPCTIHHTSPFWGELGLPESLSCLITGAVQLHLACLPSSKLAPCYKVYILKLKSNLLGVEPPCCYWPSSDHIYLRWSITEELGTLVKTFEVDTSANSG